MRRLSALKVALSVLTALAPVQSFAATFIFGGTLTGAAEVPPVATPGNGDVRVTYDDGAHTLRVAFSFSDLTSPTTLSHIHIRNPGAATGGVATEVPSFTGFPTGVTSGSYDHVFDLTQASSFNPAFLTTWGGTAAGAEAAFGTALTEGRAYLNVHTQAWPAGEIRADLTAIPEPATWGMMIVGFGLVGATLRRINRSIGDPHPVRSV